MVRTSGDSSGPILRREVEPPQRQPTGLGVVLIASAAMFFAVAGSAFIVRARMAGHCCDRAHPPATRVEVQRVAPVLEGADAPCGRALYTPRPDGTVEVDFRLCE